MLRYIYPKLRIGIFSIFLFGFLDSAVLAQETNNAQNNNQKEPAGHGYAGAIQSEFALIQGYYQFAQFAYKDALKEAIVLSDKVNQFLDNPTANTQLQVQNQWINAMRVYGITEVMRFGNEVVDQWEGRVNAWPVDEGLIDYVDDPENYPGNKFNIIANEKFEAYGRQIDASTIDINLLKSLHELGGEEANVASGYHAIEFLLWGQDLNGNQPGAGKRSHLDYSISECARTSCDRRRAYLRAAIHLLILDLKDIISHFSNPERINNALVASHTITLKAAFEGMISLSGIELAGDRLKLALIAGDPEETHNCFSDTTHISLTANQNGIIQMLNFGGNVRLSAVLAAIEGDYMKNIQTTFANVDQLLFELNTLAKQGQTMDVLIAPDNVEGRALIQKLVVAFFHQSNAIKEAAIALNLDFAN